MALDAFARLDAAAAAEVIDRDEEIDAAFRAILRQLISYMMEDPRTISVGARDRVHRQVDRAHRRPREEHRRGRRAGRQGQGRAPRVGRADPRRGRRGMSAAMTARPILVVEDEPAILELLTVNLVDAGYEVRRRADAETAHALLRTRCPISCCSTGCCPGSRGSRSPSSCARDARTKELPIIMVTARTDEADKVAGLEAWVDDYVTKPFSPRELKARIKAVLRRRAPEAAQEPLRGGRAAARSGDAPRDGRRAAGARSARPSSGCCASSSRGPSACTRARSCSTRSGATTCTSRSAPSTSTSGACGSRSSRSARTG